ncbi:hypothetical protein CPB84DRAFT_1843739 [Gymnopilus junonius]|uniref:Uncharacterized protein n=1 Tax=Gymnopilus junonius TaxID=109634 RepID=A0A9P5TRR3_GYMJU|nr:hypothetical protein CPB84DRAFT_1843739 [Gymnopilus junonius]
MASTPSDLDDGSPHLPEDLERLIFERAAYEWTPEHSSKLLLIARRVYNWVHPLVYRVFIQLESHKFPDFETNSSLILDDVGKYVKHLLAGDDTAQLDLLLSSCPNIRNLALWYSATLCNHVDAMRNLRLTTLSADLEDFPPQKLLSPTFYNLTHLDIINLGYDPSWKDWTVLADLPKLMHIMIALEFPDDNDVVEQCLEHCKVLQLFVFWKESGLGFPTETRDLEAISDERLVLVRHDSDLSKELRHEWDKGARGGIYYWMTAEVFAIARKRGFLLNPKQRWIGSSLDWNEELNERGLLWFSTL